MKHEHTPKALWLAERLEHEYSGCHQDEIDFLEMDAAAELRRMHEVNQDLLEVLKQAVREWDTNPDVITYAELMRSARAAIAKSTGGAE